MGKEVQNFQDYNVFKGKCDKLKFSSNLTFSAKYKKIEVHVKISTPSKKKNVVTEGNVNLLNKFGMIYGVLISWQFVTYCHNTIVFKNLLI